MLKNIFFLSLISFSFLYSMDPMDEDFERKEYEEVSQEEEKVFIEDKIIEKQPALVKKFIKYDFENFIFLAKVLNRKKIPIVIRNLIINFLYLPYPTKLNKVFPNLYPYSLCKFNEKLLIVGSSNGFIIILDLQKNNVVRKFKAHLNGVIDLLKMKDNIFISLSKFRYQVDQKDVIKLIIKVWNINSGARLKTIEINYRDALDFWDKKSLIKISDEFFAIGSAFGFSIWSIYEDMQVPHLSGYEIKEMFKPKVATEYFEEIKKLEQNKIFSIINFIYMENHIILNIQETFMDKELSKIKVFNIKSKTYERVYDCINVNCLLKINDFIFASCENLGGMIRVWDIRKDNYLFEVKKQGDLFGDSWANEVRFSIENGGSEIKRLIKISDDSIAVPVFSTYMEDLGVYEPGLDVKPQPEPIPECCCVIL